MTLLQESIGIGEEIKYPRFLQSSEPMTHDQGVMVEEPSIAMSWKGDVS